MYPTTLRFSVLLTEEFLFSIATLYCNSNSYHKLERKKLGKKTQMETQKTERTDNCILM